MRLRKDIPVRPATQTTTTTLLLDSLNDPANESVSREFDERYRPILIGMARRFGLDPHDAADAAQEALAQFFRDYRAGKYDRERGRLRSWLMRILHNRVRDLQRAAARRREHRGDSAMIGLPDPDEMEGAWEQEERRAILKRALLVLRSETNTEERTIRVFELVALDQAPASSVAENFSMETAEVYRIKNRLAKRLRGIVETLTDAYRTDG